MLTRTLAFGIAIAVLAGAAGLLAERARFGRTDEDTYARIERELHERFDRRAATLQALTARILESSDLVEAAPHDRKSAARLFAALDAALAGVDGGGAGISVYDSNGRPLAWSGRVSDVNRERIEGTAVQYVAPGALGPFLVRVEPVMPGTATTRPGPARIGTIVAEQILGDPQDLNDADRTVFTGSIVPVSLRTSLSPEQPQGERSFVLRSPGSGLLIEAHVGPEDVAAARRRWRGRTVAAVYATLAVTLLFCAAPFADAWRRARSRRSAAGAGLAIILALLGARVFLHAAIATALPAPFAAGLGILFNALLLISAVGLAFDAVERWRVARPRRRVAAAVSATGILRSCAAGVVNVGLLWMYERFLREVVSQSSVDLLRFSLHPFDRARLALLFGLLLLHAGVIWGGALVIRLASLGTRAFRARSPRAIDVAGWIAGIAAGLLFIRLAAPVAPIPAPPLLAALAATLASALMLARVHGRVRKASQGARLFSFYVALLVPALATYPSLLAFATQAKEAFVAGTLAPQAAGIREDLQGQLEAALVAIDARPAIELLLESSPGSESPGTDQAFALWAATELERNRLTSAVELYGTSGALVSRFALNLPEYGSTPSRIVSTCPADRTPPDWDVLEEAWNILRASRAVCTPDGQRLGAIVVRVMLDYRTLPFLSSAALDFEPGESGSSAFSAIEEAPGNDVEFAAYGWSLAPIYMDGSTVWQLPDAVLARLVASRAPFWDSVGRGADVYRVYFFSDRGGIYALGYPTIRLFGHLINLAELVVLTAVLYALLLLGSVLFRVVAASQPATGRALLREIRSSFYRKLFLAFVAVAVVPASILAVATRDRLIRQFTDSVNESAVKTATVAQRLVEDYAALQQRGGRALEGLDDQILMLVERAIGQDVNLFDRATLQATSERDLFASRLFSTRTPADVYRSIVLDQMPTFVNVEDMGGVSYLVAAARVRAGDSERIVTIPLTLRQRELDRQRDDLDRRVWSAFVLFVLLGAGLGYWTAERIADPVNRLTRATRRIARGDLDARIAATSSDELRRLVEDFNSMAADLKRQRAELERTQRLEAWADMARQVAHDIKNPLTPIQLSAEHALRVNTDRGRPLSPVLDECITAILGQVKLLRQISAEFSSFASSPTPRPERTDLPSLIHEVVEPYRTGLAGRIRIDTNNAAQMPALTLDRTLFARALTNVIENALHAMPGEGRLEIASQVAGSNVEVRIADTGVGMDQEALSRIFEPYFSTRASGTGLGLTIAKRNVELNGGTIAVESIRGSGTTVIIRLPA